MKKQIPLSAVLVLVCPVLAFAAEAGATVQSIRFTTSVTPPVYVVPKSLKENKPLLRAGLKTLPESLLVVGALVVGSGDLNLSRVAPTLFRNRRCHFSRSVGKCVGVAKQQADAEQLPPVAAPPGRILRPSHHQTQRLLRKTVRATLEGEGLSAAPGLTIEARGRGAHSGKTGPTGDANPSMSPP